VLTLTSNASAVVKQIADQTGGDGSGLRITQQSADAPALDVAPSDSPEPGDQVVEADGARVFLGETAAQTLDDMVLDAQVDQTGGVQFSITPQG
jgi:Fe-S cluster assembly iron-binding protein IscA